MKSLIFILTLISATRAVVFNCSFVVRASQYTCSQPILSNIDESETLTAVYGTHLSGRSNNEVEFLYIYMDTSVTFFPKGLANFFPILTTILINGCSITTLIGNELDAISNLDYFSLEGHPKLERIPGNLFSHTPLVQQVFFRYNNIKHVGYNLLSSLPQLLYAYFEHNYCVNQYGITSYDRPLLIEHLRRNCTDI